MNYGLPYKGSKNDIATWVVDHLPPADVFIDAFAGGCAVTHAALLSHKYKRIIANDINDTPQLFIDAIQGKYKDDRRWISRDDFFRLKDTDPYVRTIWSFGNDGKTYMYSREIEPYKKAYHYAVLFHDYNLFEELGIMIPAAIKEKAAAAATTRDTRLVLAQWIKKNPGGELKSQERLQRLQGLQGLQRLQGDYTNIPLPAEETCVIYCDPPYNKTNCGQYAGFDHARFYDWLRTLGRPAVVSEYDMPDDFILIDEITKQVKSAGVGALKGVERLFCHKSTIDQLPKTTLF